MAAVEADGLLCFRNTDPLHPDKRPLICMPQSARTAGVQRMHLAPEGGRFGWKKTPARLPASDVRGLSEP